MRSLSNLKSPISTSLLIALAAVASLSSTVRAQAVTGEEVRDAITSAVGYLKRAQLPDGTWPPFGQVGGTSALATLALLNAGESPESEHMEQALRMVRGIPAEGTYTVALKILALAAANPKLYQREIEQAARWLIANQRNDGIWGYGHLIDRGDFSNTQFALLGLHEAAQAGIKVPDGVWRKAEEAWLAAQAKDGSWAYTPGTHRGTGSMTTAGIASLYITGNSIESRLESGFTGQGRAPRCGRYATNRPLARGLTWMADNFSAQSNPGGGAWYYYYLYGVERVGILSGLRHFGRQDWYRAGATRLVRTQQPNGSWEDNSAVVDTSFALLFLVKGHRPLLIQKLKWSNEDAQWNLDRNDVAHLVGFIGDKLGERASWEVATLDQEVTDWLRSPLLYFQGHVFPKFNDKASSKLREYVEQGGTILAEACCGMDAFREGFAAFARTAFAEFPVIRVPPEHPVFSSLFELDGGKIELHAIDLGCRTSVFFSPHDLSCLWEQGDIPQKSEEAFRLGANIAAYATGREPLADKLDVVRKIERRGGNTEVTVPPRGALYIAQLMHNGDWRPDPKAVPNLAEDLLARFGVDVVRAYQPLAATDLTLRQHPILYLTGHFTFELKTEEIEALRTHLQRGGFLFADACCGRQSFDAAFRKLAGELFPDHRLERLTGEHPILAGAPGTPIPQVAYREALRREMPELTAPWLEGITFEGRTVMVYSPYGIGCGLDGHACFACRGVEKDDARRLAANVILYALSY